MRPGFTQASVKVAQPRQGGWQRWLHAMFVPPCLRAALRAMLPIGWSAKCSSHSPFCLQHPLLPLVCLFTAGYKKGQDSGHITLALLYPRGNSSGAARATYRGRHRDQYLGHRISSPPCGINLQRHQFSLSSFASSLAS